MTAAATSLHVPATCPPDAITVEIPLAYISDVAISGTAGPELFFDLDAVPKNWDAVSIPVPLPVAIRAAELLERRRLTPVDHCEIVNSEAKLTECKIS